MSQNPAQRSPLVLGVFVLVVTAILGAAAYGLNSVTNPQPTSSSRINSAPAVCNPVPSGHPNSNPQRSYTAAPPLTIDPAKQYTATMCTDRGLIVFKLRSSTAQTTNNFVYLANNGFFDGLNFHRVCPNTADQSCGNGSLKIAQGGDPKGDGTGGPGYSLSDEGPKGPYGAGTLAMARAQQISGSQFFIDTADNSSILSPQPNVYNVFGDIASGLDVALSLKKGDKMYWVAIEAGVAASPSAGVASPSAAAASPSPR
ncbi:MAG TPA: peptidylprolyl isomerase [Candidatus Dormibacteraeota bacterium]|nr:peptidylprolyl isomerase [Candidatus Dormibacteraeota bacterium]